MAIRSRRFIPIAAVAACPVIAMLIDQMARTISASWNFYKNNHFTVPAMPPRVELFLTLAGAVVVLSLGTWWGLKFKYVYLDPWPNDPKFSSIFMRMTASYAKPFYACKFIKDNKLSGKMFNYWTEGGFIAWGQQPDPNTGKTPLQLFMDGRAQAAYQIESFDLWTWIMSGGEPYRNARIRGAALDYKKIGQWISKELRSQNVWVALMPINDSTETFIKSLESNPDWPVVFLNNKERLYVDIKSPEGQGLFKGIPEEKTLYPDDFSRNLIIAHTLLSSYKGEAAMKQGLDYAIKAFELEPSPIPMQEIIYAARFSELRAGVYDFCKSYVGEFTENKKLYARKDGYRNRLMAALYACSYLYDVANDQKNADIAKFYAAKAGKCSEEQRQLTEGKRW